MYSKPTSKSLHASISNNDSKGSRKHIPQLAQQGLSDYKIARKINNDPPSITHSRQNAHKKLQEAETYIEWAKKIGIKSSRY